jgi:4-diphosphocytidyl-2-C-methyl-D-erythritol kinase
MEVSAPAKINLFLQVLGRRVDGYHELRTLMCCIGLHDTLVFRMGTPGNTLTCSDPRIPCDEGNLALKAVLLFNQALTAETTITPLNVSIELTKRIPAGAGLGGGSSDAAAVLNHLNQYYRHPLSEGELHALALSLGADVPFFIHGRPAIATGIGEHLEPFDGLPPWGVVVVFPGFGISTAEVFKNLNLGLTKCEKRLRYFPFKYGKSDIVRHLCNDLETVAAHRLPVIEKIKKELLNQGAMGSLMTGSGSAVFGLFSDLQAARRAGDALAGNTDWQVFATELTC